MPQRAVLNERTNVLAYSVDEESWSDLTAAYKAERLRLPCCGNSAIPKTSSLGTHFFAHGPHKRVECDWKEITAKHEEIIAAIAGSLRVTEWNVETEARYQDQKIDILCTHPTIRVVVAIMLELKERDGLELDEANLRLLGIPCFWLLASRLSIDATVFQAHYELPARISTGQLAREVNIYLRQFEESQSFVDEIKKSMSESNIHIDAEINRGMPTRFIVKDSLHGYSTNINVDFRERRLSFEEATFKDLLPGNRERCVRQFNLRVGEGTKLWWPGYPKVNDQTFEPLANRIESPSKNPSAREEFWPRRSYRRNQRETSISSPAIQDNSFDTSGWGKTRLKHVRQRAEKVMEPNEVEGWLDTRFDALNGRTPRELAHERSDAIEQCEMLLGLRDPVTRRPINFRAEEN